MKSLNQIETQRLNALIWAFDAGTIFRFDRITSPVAIIHIARQHRLFHIADELEELSGVNEAKGEA